MLSYLNRVPSVFACFSHYSRAFAWSVVAPESALELMSDCTGHASMRDTSEVDALRFLFIFGCLLAITSHKRCDLRSSRN